MIIIHQVATLSALICALMVQGAAAQKETNSSQPQRGLRGSNNNLIEAMREPSVEREDLFAPCTDTPSGWHDRDGDQYDCAWYASRTDRCERFGHLFAHQGLTANDVCCTCGGGLMAESFSIITSQLNGDCMSVNFADGNNVVVWECTVGKYQKFDFSGNQIKSLKNLDLCLQKNPDNNVSMENCSGMPNQDWFTDFTNDGVVFRLKGKCLTLDPNGGNTNLMVEDCTNATNQRFDIIMP